MATESKRYKHAQRDTESGVMAVIKDREVMPALDTRRLISKLEDANGTEIYEGGFSTRYLERWATLAEALTDFGSDNIHLIVNTAVTLTANTVIPSNVFLDFRKGGSIALGGFDFTDNSGVVAWDYQIFSGSGNVLLNKNSKINVKWFGAECDGAYQSTAGTDDTNAVQAAINCGTDSGATIIFPDGYTVIKSTLTVYNNTQIKGFTNFAQWDGFSREPKGSNINFLPATSLDLFQYDHRTIDGDSSAWLFLHHSSVEGIGLYGNANANNALILDRNIYCNFSYLTIDSFEVGIQCQGTINNRFEQVAIHGCRKYNIWYRGLAETTDTWDQCTINGKGLASPVVGAGAVTPTGVKFGTDAADGAPTGNSIAIRFINCLWETIGEYGMDIDYGCAEIEVIGGYCEDVPWYPGQSDAAMFRVGYATNRMDGNPTAITYTYHLKIVGGSYSGAQAGPSATFLAVDYSNGIRLDGPTISRFADVATTTANTKANSILSTGFGGISNTNIIDDTSKIIGLYPNGVMSQPSFDQIAKFGSLDISGPTGFINMYANATFRVGDSNPTGIISAEPGSIYTTRLGGARDAFYVKETGTTTDLAITSITSSTTTATATTTAPHGITDTAYVVISGAVETEYNVTALATQTGASTFTYTIVDNGNTVATGTIVYNFGKNGWVNYRPETPEYTGVILGATGVQMNSLSSEIAFSDGSSSSGGGPVIKAGAGSPEGVVTADPGSLWLGASGGAGVSLYVKESGTGNTGWVAK